MGKIEQFRRIYVTLYKDCKWLLEYERDFVNENAGYYFADSVNSLIEQIPAQFKEMEKTFFDHFFRLDLCGLLNEIKGTILSIPKDKREEYINIIRIDERLFEKQPYYEEQRPYTVQITNINRAFKYWEFIDDKLLRADVYCTIVDIVHLLVQVAMDFNKELDKMLPVQKLVIPTEFNTDKVRRLIERAVGAGYITVEAGQYKWNGEKVLLAYFAVKATTYLGLKKNHNANACWKPFESLFNVTNLKGAKADFEKYHTAFHPTGYEEIDTLFEADTEERK